MPSFFSPSASTRAALTCRLALALGAAGLGNAGAQVNLPRPPALPGPAVPAPLPRSLPAPAVPVVTPKVSSGATVAGAAATPGSLRSAQDVAAVTQAAMARCGQRQVTLTDGRLARALLAGQSPQTAAQVIGTPARRTLSISGGLPGATASLEQAIVEACSNISASGWAIDIHVQGNAYGLVLWRPLIPDWLLASGGPERAEQEMLAAVNDARRRGGQCGTESFAPSGPLRMDSSLSRTIAAYVKLQASASLTGHTGPEGSTPGTRATAQGVEWNMIGENLAYGTGEPVETVNALLGSPGHCKNILNPQFTRLGIGFAPGGSWGLTWGQLFAR